VEGLECLLVLNLGELKNTWISQLSSTNNFMSHLALPSFIICLKTGQAAISLRLLHEKNDSNALDCLCLLESVQVYFVKLTSW
jgi:hypothetical protein